MSIIVIGLGHRGIQDHIPAILESELVQLTGVVDSDGDRAREIGSGLDVPFAPSFDELLQITGEIPEVALVAVPHSEYLPIISSLAAAGVNIIKEKPFAISVKEGRVIGDIVAQADITFGVTLQRRFDPVFLNFSQLLGRIGRVYAIEARYTMNVERLDEGWRASRHLAGGGALIDLGYHYVDLIVWYFGMPSLISCRLTLGNRPGQNYDTEDTAFIQFAYQADQNRPDILGNLIVSRVYAGREESLIAYGTEGSACVTWDQCQLRDLNGSVVEHLPRAVSPESVLIRQLENFVTAIRSGEQRGKTSSTYMAHVAFIDTSYRSAGTGRPLNPLELESR